MSHPPTTHSRVGVSGGCWSVPTSAVSRSTTSRIGIPLLVLHSLSRANVAPPMLIERAVPPSRFPRLDIPRGFLVGCLVMLVGSMHAPWQRPLTLRTATPQHPLQSFPLGVRWISAALLPVRSAAS